MWKEAECGCGMGRTVRPAAAAEDVVRPAAEVGLRMGEAVASREDLLGERKNISL